MARGIGEKRAKETDGEGKREMMGEIWEGFGPALRTSRQCVTDVIKLATLILAARKKLPVEGVLEEMPMLTIGEELPVDGVFEATFILTAWKKLQIKGQLI